MELPLFSLISFMRELFDFLDVSLFMIRQVLCRSPRFSLNVLPKQSFLANWAIRGRGAL